MTLRTLIVDDERLGIQRLLDLLEAEPDVQVVGTCSSGAQALPLLQAEAVDLLFLDIRMPGMDGFELLEALGDLPLPEIVFVTAYDQYALQAFDVHAADYVLKPVQEDRFRASVDRVRRRLTRDASPFHESGIQALLEAVEQRRHRNDRFVVRDRDQIRFVPTGDVEAIESTGNYAHLHLGRESFMIRCHLRQLESRLAQARFARTHRSWMVNLDRIKAVRLLPAGGYALETHGGVLVPVSKAHRVLVDRLVSDPLPG